MDHREASGRQGKELAGEFTLRRAVADDAAALTDIALKSKAYWGYDQAFMGACLDELTVTEATMRLGETWLAEDADGRITGFFDLRAEKGIAEVYDLFVAPDRIGSGLGRLLWDRLEERAAAMNVDLIGIDADPHAVDFYTHMGAEVVGESPSGSIPGRMLPRLTKPVGRRV